MNLLLTGATGFLGSSLLPSILSSHHYKKVYLLIRPLENLSPEARWIRLANEILPTGARAKAMAKVEVIEGDLTLEGLGLQGEDFHQLIESVDQVMHLAADTDLFGTAETLVEPNIEGTRRVLDLCEALARRGRLQRVDYMSTAYVAGLSHQLSDEHDLDRGQSFRNWYEWSKFSAEKVVEEYRSRLDITVYRPSIVVGDSLAGYSLHLRGLYWPIKRLTRTGRRFIVGDRQCRVDTVSLDWVCQAVLAGMTDAEAIGETFSLTAGEQYALKLQDILNEAATHAGTRAPILVPEKVHKVMSGLPVVRSFWNRMVAYSPYASALSGMRAPFQNQSTLRWLSQRGIVRFEPKDLRKQLVDFCQIKPAPMALTPAPVTAIPVSKFG